MVCPNFSPRPLNPAERAPRVSFSFAGSMVARVVTSCSKIVLISTVTWSAESTCPSLSDCADGSDGGMSSTFLLPKTVDEAMLTATLAGMISIWPGSIARCRAACPSGSDSMDATVPTCAPCSLTLASTFITSPTRGDRTVTGTVVVKLPRNSPTAVITMATITTMVNSPASGRMRLEVIICIP